MTPTRETFGNIPPLSQWLFYALTAAACACFAWGVWRRFRLWREGRSIGLRELFKTRLIEIVKAARPGLRRLLVEGLGQERVKDRGLAGRAHVLLFLGFLALFAGTTLLEIDHLAAMASKRLHFHQGAYYVAYEYTLDVAGVLFLAGCSYFLWRRLRLPGSVGHRATDWWVVDSFIAIGLTGYLVEGLRITWQKPDGIGAHCSPVGLWVASAFAGWTESSARSAHLAVWWVHSILVLGFIASIPFTRLLHTIAIPFNLLLVRPALGSMVPVTMEQVEKEERIGVSDVRHFTQQQLLSLDACMECGRCEEACPAHATSKPLSPKKVVQDLKQLMTSRRWNAVHESIGPETLWACTACNACASVCPARVDPVGAILEMRRHLVADGGLSGTAAVALRRMQSSGNPWGLPANERSDWNSAEISVGFGAPTVQENPDFELLYWVGCAGAYDRRAQRVTRSVVRLLKAAKVNFAILGKEERCTGDSARRLGDEFLFQELAQINIATLARYKVRKIVAHCPHCLNALLKDYRAFGGDYEVQHHSQLLAELLEAGRLRPAEGLRAAPPGLVTYHDPCYLARANGIHQAPRDMLQAATGERPTEMSARREKTSCCGAGGGRMWMEEPTAQRVSTQRAAQALATGAKTIAVGCPFCLTMMKDGVAASGSETPVKDLAEILVEQLGL
ncbi:MAG: respiratory nitrate reductase subunit gamma [Verrucomicrobia bacterium]|nr:respiratory nitrate reductase subunit gamma [Verrucomicrobiota bacterium]MBI3868707.1 respiratory nitrate reductase subunit gamma [Verrucomicrobiota bacterium]